MEIVLNGAPRSIADGTSVTALVESLGLTGKRIAVEINLEIVPRSLHASQLLQSGDRVEIVHAIGGGWR
ncbi:MAG: sulfur carrier protein ThiS [Gammaproteobacteria bacterium]|nr:sulfur carrier protein ThiS [Gammaproteobacteria bacterium]